MSISVRANLLTLSAPDWFISIPVRIEINIGAYVANLLTLSPPDCFISMSVRINSDIRTFISKSVRI